MAPFEREAMTSYSILMVTLALSARVSELQPSEICLTSNGPRFDLLRSLEVQAKGTIGTTNHDFLVNFNSNHMPKYHRFEDTAFRNLVT